MAAPVPPCPRQPCVLASCLILRLSSAASVYMLITCFLLLLPPQSLLSISLLFSGISLLPLSSSVYSYCCLCSCRHLINLTCCEFICPIHCCSFLSISLFLSLALALSKSVAIFCCNFACRYAPCMKNDTNHVTAKRTLNEGQERV